MNFDDVEIEKSEDLYRGFFHMKRYSLRHKKFDGTWSPTITREVFERGPVAAVVPYDPVLDRIVLIEQFRPGPMAAGADSPWMIEVVAGILEPGETPEALAMRETVEETGGELSEILPICAFYMAPGSSSEYCHLLCGRSIRRILAVSTGTREKAKIFACSPNHRKLPLNAYRMGK